MREGDQQVSLRGLKAKLPQQVQDHDAAVRRGAVLKEVDPLPCVERHAAFLDRDGKLRQRESGADMGGHVVGALDGMAVEAGQWDAHGSTAGGAPPKTE